ncbi:MAG TPA: mechanosensitive ion channel family protein, partial [Dongiaceae bacterium]
MDGLEANYWADLAVSIGLKIAGAIVVWAIGRWLIGLAMRLLSAGLTRQKVEPTLIRYLVSFLTIALNIVLVVAILGYFGLETTSFAALIAAAGVAIGAAWAGLLSNFAAGAFLLMFRPFKVGDYIAAGGVEGAVEEIGLFTTWINTPDNVVTIIGNAKIFADNIKNYSANPYRRVELVAQLAHSVSPDEAVARLKPALS